MKHAAFPSMLDVDTSMPCIDCYVGKTRNIKLPMKWLRKSDWRVLEPW
jgi:hypothetical protein